MYQKIINKQQEFFKTHQTKNVNFRIQQLKTLRAQIIANEEAIQQALFLDLGKSHEESYLTEIGLVLTELNYLIKNIEKLSKLKKVKTPLQLFPAKSYLHYEPFGTVLVMSPWNYPFLLSLNPLIGAISTGNTVILKPSEFCINTNLIIDKIIKAVFDSNYVEIIYGEVKETTELLKHKFDFIFFTGSPNVGKIVYQAASNHLTPVVLELGGKSPAIIYDDVNLELAVKRIVFGKFINAGQTCIAPDYLMIPKDLLEEFRESFIKYTTEFYSNNPLEQNYYPKIINQRNLNRLNTLIENEEIIYGGKSNEEKLEPTLILVSNNTSKIMQEEIFGPILPIITYETQDEVLNQINSLDKPLATYVFTNKKEIKQTYINNFSTGGLVFNDTIMHFANNNLPFGGVGASGIGKYHGKSTFKTFSHEKAVLDRKTWLDIKVRYQPLNKKKINLIKKIMK